MSKVVIEFGALEELIRDSEKIRVIDSLIKTGVELNKRSITAIIGTVPVEEYSRDKTESLARVVSMVNDK